MRPPRETSESGAASSEVEHVREALGPDHISERRACRVLGQPRSTQRRTRHVPEDEPRLVRRIIDLATRYGYRRITMMLREEGWRVNHKRIERPFQLLADWLDGVRQV